MHGFLSGRRSWPLAMAGALWAFLVPLPAADAPALGTWKVTVLSQGQEITAWLVKIERKDGQALASILSALPPFRGKATSAQVDDQTVRFTIQMNELEVAVVAHFPKGEATPKKLLGSLSLAGKRDFVRLERSDLTELDPKTAVVITPAAKALQKVGEAKSDKDREAVFKEIIEKFSGQPMGYTGAQGLLFLMVQNQAAEAEVRAHIEKTVQLAAAYGPEMELAATLVVVQALSPAEKLAGVRLDYARQAERLLPESPSATTQVAVLKPLAAALRKAGKAAEATDVDTRLAKYEAVLDQEYLKTAIPFQPDTFAGRQGKGNRVVLLELFTGAQCPPCVPADLACDALLQTYKPSEVVLLQYHLHAPAPDPLTNADDEKRAQFYNVAGTPALFLNGKEGPPVGGLKQHTREHYKTLRKLLDEELEAPAQAQLKLSADRKGDRIAIQAEVAGLKQAQEDVRLRLVLVEDMVRYTGRNGLRLHHHVVRVLPGGVDGLAVKDGSAKQSVTVSVPELSQSLLTYLTNSKRRFLDGERPLDLKHLKVIALVQDDKTKEVLQATQVDVP
jgi:hypothetical protein